MVGGGLKTFVVTYVRGRGWGAGYENGRVCGLGPCALRGGGGGVGQEERIFSYISSGKSLRVSKLY